MAMRPTDNDPKGNDPIYRDPTNQEIVHYLRDTCLHFSCYGDKATMDKMYHFYQFDFRTHVGETLCVIEAQFVDLATWRVAVVSSKEKLAQYPRGNALASLLCGQVFPDVPAFAVACRNALGDDLETFPLTGCIFTNQICVDSILEVLEDKRFATVFVEPLASPAEDKTTDGKERPRDTAPVRLGGRGAPSVLSPAEENTQIEQELAPCLEVQDFKMSAEDFSIVTFYMQTKADDKEIAPPAEDKTDDGKELAEEVKELKQRLEILQQLVTILCHKIIEN